MYAQENGPLKIRNFIKDYTKVDCTICSFGASVTAQKDSIWDHFVEKLNEKTGRNHKHVKIGLGGHFLYPASLYCIDEIVRARPDICILDWFDTGYTYTSDLTNKCLEALIRKLHEINCYIICYYHIREDYLDKNRLNFIDYVDQILYKYNVSSYYEYDAVQLNRESIKGDLLRDIVHSSAY